MIQAATLLHLRQSRSSLLLWQHSLEKAISTNGTVVQSRPQNTLQSGQAGHEYCERVKKK